MKKIILSTIWVLFSIVMLAQVPRGITHQAVIRDPTNQLVINQSIGVRISIIQNATNGPVVYSETHSPTSNANGLITFVIGHGTPVSGDFEDIDWTDGPYFLKTEADPTGGTNYTITGTMQFLSVPYALHAGSSSDNQWEQSSWGNIFSKNTGNVGIGSQYPNSRLFVTGWASDPGIPSASSQGILRLGILQEGGIDIGKINTPPFSMWMQAGWNGEATDPISLQPLGGEIGIGTLTPEAQLHTTGSVRFEGAGTPGEGRVLKSDENGLATWQTPTSGSNWISDENDIYRETGNVGIGVQQPQGKLHVSVPGEWLGVVFTGTGPDDLDVDISAYNGTGATAYAVRIENTGPVPNMVETSNDGGTTWSIPIPIAPDIDMGYGVIVNFGSTSGYTEEDRWDWTVNESFADVLVVKDDMVGIGTNEPTQILDVDGLLRIRGGNPGEGKILTSDANGNAFWGTHLFQGDVMQTLRHNGTGWVANSFLKNNGTGLSVGELAYPQPNSQLYLSRVVLVPHSGYPANIFAYRTSWSGGGVSWHNDEVDVAIKGQSGYSKEFTAGVAGYFGHNTFPVAGVIGRYSSDLFGALAYASQSQVFWAGYFLGDVSISGVLQIEGGSPEQGNHLSSAADGTASWQHATNIIVNSEMSCIDIDGNAYPTVVIGNQLWMAENLRVTKYRNGEFIHHVIYEHEWGWVTIGAYCWYDNNQSANAKYGALYNLYAVNDPRGLCPEGWRVPTDAEWTAFTNMLGGSSVAGGKLKAVSPLWDSPNKDATNSTGFSALPGGSRWSQVGFSGIGSTGYWWSSYSGAPRMYRTMSSNNGSVGRYQSNIERNGFGVRCVRDL